MFDEPPSGKHYGPVGESQLTPDLREARRKAIAQLQSPGSWQAKDAYGSTYREPAGGIPDYMASAMNQYGSGVDTTDTALQALSRVKGGPALRAGNEAARGAVASHAGLTAYGDYLGTVNSAEKNGLSMQYFDVSSEVLDQAKKQEKFNKEVEERAAGKKSFAEAYGAWLSFALKNPQIGAGATKLIGDTGKKLEPDPLWAELAKRRESQLQQQGKQQQLQQQQEDELAKRREEWLRQPDTMQQQDTQGQVPGQEPDQQQQEEELARQREEWMRWMQQQDTQGQVPDSIWT
jgi:hypothetical protein